MQLERGKSSTGIHRVHDVEVHTGQCAHPTLVIPINIVPQALIDGFVGTFACTIHFQMIQGGHLKLNTC